MLISPRTVFLSLIVLVGLLKFTEAIFSSALTNEANKLEKMVEMQLEYIKKLVTMTDDGNRHRRELIGITKKQVGMIDDMLDHIKKKGKKETRPRRRRPRPTKKPTDDEQDQDDS